MSPEILRTEKGRKLYSRAVHEVKGTEFESLLNIEDEISLRRFRELELSRAESVAHTLLIIEGRKPNSNDGLTSLRAQVSRLHITLEILNDVDKKMDALRKIQRLHDEIFLKLKGIWKEPA